MGILDFYYRLRSGYSEVSSDAQQISGEAQQVSQVPRPGRKILRFIVIGLLIVLLLAGLILLGWWLGPRLQPTEWKIIGAVLLGLALVWLLLRGIPRYRQYRFLKRQQAELAAKNLVLNKEPGKALLQGLLAAKKVIARSPELEGGANPLYRVPWLLILGEESAGQGDFLRAAMDVSPFPAPETGSDEQPDLWNWWFFKGLIAIATGGRFVCEVDAKETRGIWYQALQILAQHRPLMPLNGIVAMVSVDTLRQGEDAVREYGIRMRRLVDEAMQFLRLELPVYVVVSRCEALPGYAEYASCLPEGATRQCLGHRLGTEASEEAPEVRFEQIFAKLRLRLHTIRLGVIQQSGLERSTRKGVYDFVEAFSQHQGGLGHFVKALFERNPFQRTPHWRGLYFVGDQRRGAYTADLFTRFLPQDQPLARRTQKASLFRWLRFWASAAVIVGISWFVSRTAIDVHQQDTQLLSEARQACLRFSGKAMDSDLSALLACGRNIGEIDARRHERSFSFAMYRSSEELDRLKNDFRESFRRHLLLPLARIIEKHTVSQRASFADYLSVVGRLRLISQCRTATEVCGDGVDIARFIFSGETAGAIPLVSNARDAGRAQALEGGGLLRGYLAYLRWQPDESGLVEEQDELKKKLRQLMRGDPPALAEVERWAAGNFRPQGPLNLWKLHAPVYDGDDVYVPALHQAYTREFWEGLLAPVTASIDANVPDTKEQVKTLRKDYLSVYFRRWQEFVTRYPNGYKYLTGDAERLVEIMAGKDNPYAGLWSMLGTNLFEMPLPSGYRLPAWALALEHTLEKPWKEAAPILKRLFFLLLQDKEGEEVYSLASAIYTPGSVAASDKAQDFLKLRDLLSEPQPEDATSMLPEDNSAWRVVQGPSELFMKLLAQRAALYVEGKWQDDLVKPLSLMRFDERQRYLVENSGRVDAFVKAWLLPFLKKDRQTPKEAIGVHFPISTGFRQFVRQVPHLKETVKPSKPFNAGIVKVTKDARAGAKKAETIFELECQTRQFTASSSLSKDRRTNVFWSPDACADVRIKIAIVPEEEDPESVKPFTLIKIYPGALGFQDFIEDFRKGSKAFTLAGFRRGYSGEQWRKVADMARELKIRSIRTYITIEPSKKMRRFMSGPSPVVVPVKIVEQLVYKGRAAGTRAVC